MQTHLNSAAFVSEATGHHLACAEKPHEVFCSLVLAVAVWKVLAIQDWVFGVFKRQVCGSKDLQHEHLLTYACTLFFHQPVQPWKDSRLYLLYI